MVDARAVQGDQGYAGAVLDVVDRDVPDPALHPDTVERLAEEPGPVAVIQAEHHCRAQVEPFAEHGEETMSRALSRRQPAEPVGSR